jgi:hypothetical protein
MIIGVLGLLITLFFYFQNRDRVGPPPPAI